MMTGGHPNLGTPDFRAALAKAPSLQSSYLAARPDVFEALISFIVERDLLPTMHKHESGIETWSLGFNRDRMYRVLKLDIFRRYDAIVLWASSLAFRCEVESERLHFFPVKESLPPIELHLKSREGEVSQLEAVLREKFDEAARYKPDDVSDQSLSAPLE